MATFSRYGQLSRSVKAHPAASVPPPPSPPPPATPTYAFRALFDTGRLSLPNAKGGLGGTVDDFTAMNLTTITAYLNPSYTGTTNDGAWVTVLNNLASGINGYFWTSGYVQNASGGYIKLEDPSVTGSAGRLERVLSASAGGFPAYNHPRNSHRYFIADDTQIVFTSDTNMNAGLTYLKGIRDRIHAVYTNNGSANTPIVALGAFRTTPASRDYIGRFANIVDEVWLSVYPYRQTSSTNTTPKYDATLIPAAAGICDPLGMKYLGDPQAHDTPVNNPYLIYPTPAIFDTIMSQWKATQCRGLAVYNYTDGDGTTLANDPANSLRDEIGAQMLIVTP